MNRNSQALSLDVVIPVYNEEEMIEYLTRRLGEVFSADALKQAGVASVRYLLIDDGSSDRTADMVCRRIEAGFPGVLIRLSRNFGHQNALSAGLSACQADLVAVIDADLQDPPEIVLKMIQQWRQGSDVVYGQRRKRKEGAFKRLGYWCFYRIVGFLSEISIPLDSGDFCLMGRNVVEAIGRLPENLRFIRGLRAWVGFRQSGLEYDRPARQAGQTKYTLRKLYRLATDGIASSSTRPLKVAQVFSVSYFLLTVIVSLLLLISLGLADRDPISTWFLVAYLLVVSGNGIMCICIYILGAYIGRTYLEAKDRPPYVVMEKIGTASHDCQAYKPAGRS